MKSRAARMLGRNVRLQDGTVGQVIGHASQERRLMLKLSMEDSTVRWVHACDTIPAEDPAPPTAKARRTTKKG